MDALPQSPLDELIKAASDGDLTALDQFYRCFLHAELVVPIASQAAGRAKNQVSPKNRILEVLALQHAEKVIVPVFSSNEQLAQWSEQVTQTRRMRASDLLNLVEEHWWIVLNVGDEFSKEISGWEIEKLKHGEQAIAEIIEEFREANEITPLDVSPVTVEDYHELQKMLEHYAQQTAEVLRITILKEQILLAEKSSSYRPLIGALISPVSAARRKQIQEELCSLANSHVSGELVSANVQVADNFAANPLLGMCQQFPALYEKRTAKPGFFRSLASALGGHRWR